MRFRAACLGCWGSGFGFRVWGGLCGLGFWGLGFWGLGFGEVGACRGCGS